MMGEVIRVSGRAPDVGDLLREAMVSQRFADVALCCSGGQRFLAHRLVLSAASPYLQDVLLAHSKAAGYSEPITIILAEVEGPELSAILGFVYTGSATIPKSRLEAFTRAAETLHVTIPAFPGASTSEFSNREMATLARNNADDLNLDNVKIEEATRRNDGRYLRCEQYPSYGGWLNSSSWHFHDDCSKRYYRPEDWIITRNEAPSRTTRRSIDDIHGIHRSYVDARNDVRESDKSLKDNDNENDGSDFPIENHFGINESYCCEMTPERVNCADEGGRRFFFKDKQSSRSWLENHPGTADSRDSFVGASTALENRDDERNYDFPAEIRAELACFDDEKSHSYSASDNSVSRMNLDSSRRYDPRDEKDRLDGNFEGSPERGGRVASSLLSRSTTGRSSIDFEKQDYDYSRATPAPSRLSGGSSAATVLGAKIATETAVTSTVTSDSTANFDGSTLLRAGGDLCGESCCRWRTPRRHVANRVPASPWCQLARPAHHSPKTRPVVLRNREESFETPPNDNWNESIRPSENHTNAFPTMSMTYIDNNIENPSFSAKPDANINDDSSGLIYGYRVPKTTEISLAFQENLNYANKPHNQNLYEEKSNKSSSVFSTMSSTSIEKFPSIIIPTEIVRSMENSRSIIDIGDPSQLRQIDRVSSSILNPEQSRVRVPEHAISPKATNKQIINDLSTCNLQPSTKVELSHPISRLCDSVRKIDESISQDGLHIEKNIERNTNDISKVEIREFEGREEVRPKFCEKSVFSISVGVVQSDDNNNEARFDETVVDNVGNVDVNPRVLNEAVADDGGNNSEEHRCDQCGKTFVTRASLKVHGRTHSGEKPFRCNDCGKEFSQLRNYKYHRSVHEGTREFAATCPECGKYFNDRGYLSSHMKIHRNRKEYACSECGKSFNQRVAYNMHVRIHTGIKPHQCEQCGKAFSRKMLLKQHLRTHSGERPYQCQICHKAFADRSNMTLHTRLHSGLKPYQCTLCSKAFTKKHHLKTHLNYHTGTKPYSCPNCSLRFSQSSNMRTHYKKCCSIVEIDPSKRENSSSRGKNAEQSPAPSSDSLAVSRVAETPSIGGRTNALTPPSSDQESSIHTPIKINDVLLHSTARGNNLNKDSTNVPDT